MEILYIDINKNDITMKFSKDELGFLIQAMNEACNGLSIPESEFQTRIGYDRFEGDHIMDVLMEAYKKL